MSAVASIKPQTDIKHQAGHNKRNRVHIRSLEDLNKQLNNKEISRRMVETFKKCNGTYLKTQVMFQHKLCVEL